MENTFRRLRKRVLTPVGDRSMTIQADRDKCDINKIMEKYHKTGMVTHISGRGGVFLDCSNFQGYRESLEKVRLADEAFAGLTAKVRDRFKNDPAELMLFLSDPKNRDEAESLGLVQKRDLSPVTPEKVDKGTGEVKPA